LEELDEINLEAAMDISLSKRSTIRPYDQAADGIACSNLITGTFKVNKIED